MKGRLLAFAAALAAPLVAAACGSAGTASTGAGGSTASSTGSGSTDSSSTAGSTTSTTSSTGSTGGSMASTTSGTGGATSTGSGGPPCTVGSTDCGVGFYCDAPGCTSDGTCAPVAVAEDPVKAPVCGCDGMIYWNASIAAKNAVSVAHGGTCASVKPCGGFTDVPCPQGTVCSYQIPDVSLCKVKHPSGICWAMPTVCMPALGVAPTTRACKAAACADECEFIKSGASFYVDATCPQ
jgi:hypothetical protein